MEKEDVKKIIIIQEKKNSTEEESCVECETVYKITKLTKQEETVEEKKKDGGAEFESGKNIKECVQQIEKFLKSISCFSAVVPVVLAGLLKFFKYIYELGVVRYWKINPSEISLTGVNILYDSVFLLIEGIIVCAIFLLPLAIVVWVVKKWKKTIYILIIIVLAAVYLLESAGGWIILREGSTNELVSLIGLVLAFEGLYFTPSIVLKKVWFPKEKKKRVKTCKFTNKFRKRKEKILLNKIEKKISKLQATMWVIVWIAIMLVCISWVGYLDAQNEREFRIVNLPATDNSATIKEYAIVYENEESYFLAECEAGKPVVKNQRKIEKGNIEFEWNCE